jgi:vancomycin permeability regulator SanA
MDDDLATAPSFFETRAALSNFLFLKDEARPVDLCFVLGSPTVSSMQPAIDLYRRNLTPWILVSGYGPPSDQRSDQRPECELYKEFAVANGVPGTAILLERRATNTLENFIFSRQLIEEELGWTRIRTVAIAGKPFHMRRALMTARRHWPGHLGYVMQPSADPADLQAESWWKTEQGRQKVLAELRAIATYALQGDIGGY